ncbi:hypothetical protein TNCV_1299141 [Trichonephila clavipes]|nr:hypothetical protein TNCV_1299141 [Trichonephila clavipes]
MKNLSMDFVPLIQIRGANLKSRIAWETYHHKNSLPVDVVEAMRPVFRDLANPELLKSVYMESYRSQLSYSSSSLSVLCDPKPQFQRQKENPYQQYPCQPTRNHQTSNLVLEEASQRDGSEIKFPNSGERAQWNFKCFSYIDLPLTFFN